MPEGATATKLNKNAKRRAKKKEKKGNGIEESSNGVSEREEEEEEEQDKVSTGFLVLSAPVLWDVCSVCVLYLYPLRLLLYPSPTYYHYTS
jgi:hypothetical protein